VLLRSVSPDRHHFAGDAPRAQNIKMLACTFFFTEQRLKAAQNGMDKINLLTDIKEVQKIKLTP
jgi:hypothetical protein